MGFFGKLFEKKECAICGGEIGLLGNRKLEDGNMCKQCAAKLSPWFSDRRNSTIAEIEEQLAYREANKEKVAAFHVTRTMGTYTKLMLDEDNGVFMVTSARNWEEVNPDVIRFDQVTGVDVDIDETYTEEKRETKDKDGKIQRISYNPPRYSWEYDFHVTIQINSPYFDQIRIRLNSSNVELNPDHPLPQMRKPNPEMNPDYCEYKEMAQEIKHILTEARAQVRAEAKAAAAPKAAVTCPYCGATTTPDASGCCEYCGGAVNG